jgi:outer membrane receptor for ferrienterochelin and colicins
MIVTASKRTQKIDDSPASISVITARDLEQKNQIYLDQLLEDAPGVNFMGNQINIRGSSGYSYGVGSRVLFLVDGIPVMAGDTGRIIWDLIPASQIERVEIVKSAGSALYGSTALGGVVNVITKEPTSKPETNLRFSSGIYDDSAWPEWKWTDDLLYYSDMDVDHSRKIGKVGMFLSVGRHQSTGYRQNAEYLNYNATGKFKIPLTPQSNMTVLSNWESGENEISLMWRNPYHALEVEEPSVGDKMESNKFGLNILHQWTINQSFGLKSRVSYFRNYFKYLMHDNDDYSTAQRLGLELQAYYILSNSHSFTFGTEETADHISSNPLGKHDIINLSVYAQDEIRLLPTLLLTLGARFDYTSTDTDLEDEEFSPKMGFVWHITDITTLRYSSGKGFRAPSISERFPDVYASGLKIVPNLDLKPETAWSHEIGFSTPLSAFLLFDIAVFRNEYWDLIEPVPDLSNTIQFVNLTRARISGVETNIRFSLCKRHIDGQLGYTYLDPKDIELDETLGYRSKHMLNGSITGRYRNMELGLDYKYYEKLEVVKVYPDDPRVPQKVLDGRFSIQFDKWMFSVNVNNILNHMHTQIERTIMPIRNYTATVKLQL